MAWAWWLGAPVLVTGLASLVLWWRGRPVRVPGSDEAMQGHRDYLDALVVPARGTRRVARAGAPPADRPAD